MSMRPRITQDARLPRAPFAHREAEFGASSGTFLCLTKLNSMGDAIGIVAVRQINYLSASLSIRANHGSERFSASKPLGMIRARTQKWTPPMWVFF